MAGRIDQTALEGAVARASKTGPHHDAIRQHLEEVFSSSDFRGSRRSQTFLRRVIDYALEGDFDSLKERLLGINVFGRSADYDTSEDAIVRVTANDVRRRLKQFYASVDRPALRIDLPPGSYVPEFHIDDSLLSPEYGLDQPQLESLESSAAEKTAEIPHLSVVSPQAEVMQKPAFSSTVVARISAGVLMACALVASGWWLGHRSAGRLGSTSQADNGKYGFYRELLGAIAAPGPMGVDIVLSDPHVLIYKGDQTPATQPADFYTRKVIQVPRELEPALNEDANDDEASFPYHHLEVKTTSFTVAGEAEAAFRLRGLFDILGRSTRLTEARFLNWDKARDNHIVLLAPPSANAWTNKNLTGSDFVMQRDAILNLHRRPGEQSVYRETFGHDWLNDYGVIWMSENPSGSRILLLSGLTSAGTEGLGQFFTDPAQMKPIYNQLRARGRSGEIPSNWELLARISARENVPLHVTVLALHILPDPSLHTTH
jgi:hypothetical protein